MPCSCLLCGCEGSSCPAVSAKHLVQNKTSAFDLYYDFLSPTMDSV